jgi:hypothetical protein
MILWIQLRFQLYSLQVPWQCRSLLLQTLESDFRVKKFPTAVSNRSVQAVCRLRTALHWRCTTYIAIPLVSRRSHIGACPRGFSRPSLISDREREPGEGTGRDARWPTLQRCGAKREAMVAVAKELFDVVQSGEVNININETYPLRMCPRRIATLKRARPRFDGAYDLADCRYGAAPR